MKTTSAKVLAGLCLLLGQAHGRGELVLDGAGGTGGTGGGDLVAGTGGAGGGTIESRDGVLVGTGDTSKFGEGAGSPYYDLTPICNYLERGIDDQQPGKRDGYVLQPPGIATLADIDRIAFGLDLPATHCSDNPRTVPCSADTDPKSWCIERVELELMGMKLVDLSAPTSSCLLTAHGGTKEAGITGLSHLTLRSLPTWGFSDAELERLLGSLGRGADGKPAFLPRQLVLPGEYLGRTLEGVVGQVLTRDAVGCTNELYCGIRPNLPLEGGGSRPTIRLANAGEVDCDLGDCPATTARKSSPWVEVAGEVVAGTPVLHFDIDFAVDRDKLFSDDCSSLEPGGPFDTLCAINKEMMAHGSLEIDAAVRCEPFALVDFERDGHAVHMRLPYCDGGMDKCFQPGVNKNNGTIVCPAQAGGGFVGNAGPDPDCGESASVVRATFDQRMDITDQRLDLEGGIVVGLGEFFCGMMGCDFNSVANLLLGGMMPDLGAVGGVPLFQELAGCPAVGVGADGTLTINLADLDACYPGSPVPGCGDLVLGGHGDGAFGRGDEPADDFALVTGDEEEAPALPSSWTIGGTPAALVKGQIGGLVAAPPKHSMAEINAALEKVCGLAEACDPELSIQSLPLREMAAISVAALEAAAASGDVAAAWDEVGFLAESAAFRHDCLAWAVPAYNGAAPTNDLERGLFLLHLQAWVNDALEPGIVACEAQGLDIESMFPAMGLTVRVTTAGGSVQDRFAFVNFKDNYDVTPAERAAAGCGFRTGQGLPMADAPKCGSDGLISAGPDDAIGEVCGTMPGGPCADITADYYYPDFAGFGGIGNDPRHVNQHPNGSAGWNRVCFPDEEQGRPMVCVNDTYPGAGPNIWPTCKICGIPADGEDADLYTMEGCPPIGPECPAGLALGSDGKCWDVNQGRPEWECAADCGSLYGDTGYCQHGGPWLDFMRQTMAVVGGVADDLESAPYAQPICVDWLCPDAGIRCGWQGQACFNGDTCVDECLSNADCHDNVSSPAYPDGFVCGAELTCVPPG